DGRGHSAGPSLNTGREDLFGSRSTLPDRRMDCAVIYSEAALADLQQITAFIAADNPKVAERFANRLVDLAESLRSLPERGRPVKKWPGVRAVVLSPYLIFY